MSTITANSVFRKGLAPQPTRPDTGGTTDTGRHAAQLPKVHGKFLFVGDQKFWIKGVTYGTFRPDAEGFAFPNRERVSRDFAQMASAGINSVRVYTPPPRWLLDAAHTAGLRVMVGLPWEQHVAFLESRRRARDIVRRVRAAAKTCAGHPALLCFAVGNEIPAPIVRWHGQRRIERFIETLYRAVKSVAPDALVTYVNFPTTEYLRLPFLDFHCFNVYLEARERFEDYLARLQNLAGEKPILMAEIGLDSLRNGCDAQAKSLDWQIRTAFAAGCVGAFAFAWTDEWHRGGHDIEDWDFGLTTRDRTPKPALEVVSRAFADAPFPASTRWPRISVVVCSCNGARTIRDTFEAIKRLEYPNFETIVIDDGSRDETPKIAAAYDVKLISTENRGLSAARNTGWQEATGEIVAYIDDDAYPDPHWLQYLAYRFMTGDWVGVGGPNIAPAGDGPIADCVANAPGGPVHVLVTDTEAEHIPGCNMAFRREALAAVGGFDARYRAAGDDVDLCWRLQERGGRIGFHAAAMDWHHRRNSLAMYWRQQKGYGKAEALLEEKWPERYNAFGHLAWGGRLYGRGFALPIPFGRARIYGGVWGTAAYQRLYEPAPPTLLSLPLMPEWYLVIAALAVLALLSLSWPPLMIAVPCLGFAVAAPIVQAALAASRAHYPTPPKSAGERAVRWLLTFYMHLVQPLARLYGRIDHGLTPWRRRSPHTSVIPRRIAAERWREKWRSHDERVEELASVLRDVVGVPVRMGGAFDRWDLDARSGPFGSARIVVAAEEHGAGKQLVRVRAWPRIWGAAGITSLVTLTASLVAATGGAVAAAAVLLVAGVLLLQRVATDAASSLAAVREALARWEAG